MRALLVVLTCLMVAACADLGFKPGEKSHARRDAPPGPGVLTGQQGEFVIYRLEGDTPESGAKEPRAQ